MNVTHTPPFQMGIRKVMGDFWLARIFFGPLPVQEFFGLQPFARIFFFIKSSSCTICY